MKQPKRDRGKFYVVSKIERVFDSKHQLNTWLASLGVGEKIVLRGKLGHVHTEQQKPKTVISF